MAQADETEVEPMCRRTLDRFIMFDHKYPDLYEMAKQQQTSMWSAEEVDLQTDVPQWRALKPSEREVLSHVLAFFASAEQIVNENIGTNFFAEVTLPEARAFYAWQMAIEVVHSEVYSLLIETYIAEAAERDRLFHAIKTMPSVRAKAEWALKWTDPSTASLAERLLAFVLVEGLGFSGSFCTIFYMKSRGLLPGLCFANELISRDEALHTRFGVSLYSKLDRKLPEARVHEMMRGAVEAEVQFITVALQCAVLGMNADSMTEYIQAVCNVLCGLLGVSKLYPDATNPYDFMTLCDLEGKSNFFERRVGEYAATKTVQTTAAGLVIDLDF